MISPTILFTVSLFWANYSDLIYQDTRLFLWAMGVVFSNIAVHLIISQMSVTRAQEINGLLVVYSLIAVLSIFKVFGAYDLWVLRILAVFLTFAHIHYGICVVSKMI